MRLAEPRSHAYAALEMAAAMNPFVVGIRVVLSGSHPKPDICDEAAAAGPWPKDRIPSIKLDAPALPVATATLTDNAAAVPRDLRDEVRAERAVLVERSGRCRWRASWRSSWAGACKPWRRSEQIGSAIPSIDPLVLTILGGSARLCAQCVRCDRRSCRQRR